MEPPHSQDLALAREVASGSRDAWEQFVHRYSGLIFSVIRRYLFKEDEDELRNVYVRVLEDLYTRRLAEYDASSSLSTWIVTITRSRSLDFLRNRYGRRSAPRWLEGLGPQEQRVYALHYIEGLSVPEVVRRLEGEGRSISDAAVMDSLHEIGNHMTKSLRKRLALDLQARNGVSPLESLHEELKRAQELASEHNNPEYTFFLQEQEENLRKLRTYIDRLEPEEREILHLYFDQGLTARETAARMDMSGPRRAYTVLNRVVRRLRSMFESADVGRKRGHAPDE